MIKKELKNDTLAGHLASLQEDGRHIFILNKSNIRCTLVNGSTMLNQMRANHELNYVDSHILGEAYLAGALLCSTLKGQDRIQLTIECGGPVGGVYIEAGASGWVRGYLKNHSHDGQSEGVVDTNPLYGPGFLTITKLLEDNKTPFSGQVMLQYGILEKDLQVYFSESEQTPSLFRLSIAYDKDQNIIGAGGIFFQVLPGSEENALDALDEMKLPSLAQYLATGGTIENYVSENFEKEAIHLATTPLAFTCSCERANFASYLSRLPRKEKDEILANGPFPLELVCFNCNSKYEFEKEELIKLLK